MFSLDLPSQSFNHQINLVNQLVVVIIWSKMKWNKITLAIVNDGPAINNEIETREKTEEKKTKSDEDDAWNVVCDDFTGISFYWKPWKENEPFLNSINFVFPFSNQIEYMYNIEDVEQKI